MTTQSEGPDATQHNLRGRTVFILYLVAAALSLALGLAFVVILFGLMPIFAMIYLFVTDRQSARKMFGPPYHRRVWLPVRVLAFLGAAIYFLIGVGFCGQNLICMLLR
jgi:Ni,Fe-hydrogenase I cytochrome b subunit